MLQTSKSLVLLFSLLVTIDGPKADKPKADKPKGEPAKEDSRLASLEKRLKGKNINDRVKAAQEIGELGDDGKPLAKALCAAATDPSPKVAEAALAALEKVRPDLHKPVAIIATYNQINPTERVLHAIGDITKMGQDAAPAAPTILSCIRFGIALLNQPSLDVGPSGRHGEELIYPCLEAMLAIDPDNVAFTKLVLQYASERFKIPGHLPGPKTSLAPPIQDLSAPMQKVRSAAIKTLGKLKESNPQHKQVVCVLVWCLYDQPTDRFTASPAYEAAQSLGSLGPAAKEAVPYLKKLKSHPDQIYRDVAEEALKKIER